MKYYWEISLCPHRWNKVGLGYECEFCGFYTSNDHQLNEYINEERIQMDGRRPFQKKRNKL